MTVEPLTGRTWTRGAAQKVSPRLFGCVMCPRGATSWDHCHAHGVIRGPLCTRCNRLMCDVDAGLISAEWGNRERQGISLCRHGVGQSEFRPAEYTFIDGDMPKRYTWMPDELFWSGRPTGVTLYEYRARCIDCEPGTPPIAQWVIDRATRARVFDTLTAAGWWPTCAWCPITQHIHGAPPQTPKHVQRNLSRARRDALAGDEPTGDGYPGPRATREPGAVAVALQERQDRRNPPSEQELEDRRLRAEWLAGEPARLAKIEARRIRVNEQQRARSARRKALTAEPG